MKTLKELQIELNLHNVPDVLYYQWYKEAITWILKDIQESEVLSIDSIEIYLKKLLEE
jgi:hypothetical protein